MPVQFDVHRNAGPSKAGYPLLIVLQSNLFRDRERCVLVPLIAIEGVGPEPNRLNPFFTIGQTRYSLAIFGITNVPRSHLGSVVTNLSEESDRIIDAVDWLISRGAR